MSKKKYKGRLIAVVQQEHVGKPFTEVNCRCIGQIEGTVCQCDVGKQIYYDCGFVSIENNEQLKRRLREADCPTKA